VPSKQKIEAFKRVLLFEVIVYGPLLLYSEFFIGSMPERFCFLVFAFDVALQYTCFFPLLYCPSFLKSLNLSSNALCGADGGALDGLSALTGIYTPRGGKPANSTLCRLNLTHNDLGEDAALLIGRGFLQEPACCLAELDLRHNKFGGARGYIHLAYSLRSHPDPGTYRICSTSVCQFPS